MKLLLVFLLAAACATTGGGGDEAAVIDTLHQACRAYREANVEQMRALLSDDFTLTDSDGVVTTREDDLRNAETGAIRYTVFENRDMIARIHGDAAIVTGITEVAGTAGTATFAATFQFTDTLVRDGNRWRVAASHISRRAS